MTPLAPTMTAESAKRGLVGQRMPAVERVVLGPRAGGLQGPGGMRAEWVPAALAVQPVGAADATVRHWLA